MYSLSLSIFPSVFLFYRHEMQIRFCIYCAAKVFVARDDRKFDFTSCNLSSVVLLLLLLLLCLFFNSLCKNRFTNRLAQMKSNITMTILLLYLPFIATQCQCVLAKKSLFHFLTFPLKMR